jgi:uncharacterized membrane protein YjjB (DUF3815 family)
MISGIQLYWFILASLLYFGAGYIGMVWSQVGGVRGLALATSLLCGAIICSCFGILQSHQALVPNVWLLAIHRAAWWPLMLSGLLLADMYAADHNDHRTVTTKLYESFKRFTRRYSEQDRLL